MPSRTKTSLGLCAVCDAGCAAKYRCPACRTPYCSLACFKAHKQDADGCAAAGARLKAAAASKRKRSAGAGNSNHGKTKKEKKHTRAARLVPMERLAKLEADAGVRGAAKSTGLQAVIREIVAAQQPQRALKARLERDPGFREFANKVLVAVGAVDEDVGPSGALQLELGAFTGGSDGDEDGKQVNEVRVEVAVKKDVDLEIDASNVPAAAEAKADALL